MYKINYLLFHFTSLKREFIGVKSNFSLILHVWIAIVNRNLGDKKRFEPIHKLFNEIKK